MKYLLDTDHISILQIQSGVEYIRLTTRIAALKWSDFCVCAVSFHEQILGIHAFINRAKTDADLLRGYGYFDAILNVYATARLLPFDAAALTQANDLAASRIRIATMDLRIAAIALSTGMTLLTRNKRDLGRVPGLRIDDWTI